MNVLRRLDQYNFTISTELDEPKVISIKGKEVVYKYKNQEKYYGTLYEAIRGLCRFNKVNYFDIPIDLKKIRPRDNEEVYVSFLEVGLDEIKEIIKKEYQC